MTSLSGDVPRIGSFQSGVLTIWKMILKPSTGAGVHILMQGLKFGRLFGVSMFPMSPRCFFEKPATNLLHTKENLFYRRVVGDHQLCTICTVEVELVVHILWMCPSAMDVWSSGPRSLQKCCGGGTSFSSVFEALLRTCGSEDIEIWAVLTRKIWLGRNFIVFGGAFTSSNQLVKEAYVLS